MDGDVMEILNTFEYVEKIPGWQIAILVIFGITLIFFEVFLLVKNSGVEVGPARLEHLFSLRSRSLCLKQRK